MLSGILGKLEITKPLPYAKFTSTLDEKSQLLMTFTAVSLTLLS